jgi:2-iminobutanoate/2-iminopropanoate deaminase
MNYDSIITFKFEEKTMKTIIRSASAPAPIGPYSQAVKTGNLIFCSGMIALDPVTGQMIQDSIAAETKQVMLNIAALLQEAGAGFENIVKTTIFLISMDDFAAVNEVYGSFFNDHFPARETVAVAGLPKNARVEISVTVAMP